MITLAFVVFVRMELRTVSLHQQRTQARANAKLGIELAIAQLQEQAGPDTRVTGTASLFDSNPSTPLIDGVAHPYWTGVWRKSDPDSRAHDPDFLGWLVSLRNENLLDSALTNALDPDYVIDVVGPGSVPNPQYRVYAEKQDITAPGEASASGRFAYAVLDEGVKASVSLADPYEDSTESRERQWAQALAQRQGLESVPAFAVESNGRSVLIDSADRVESLPSLESLKLLDPGFSTGMGQHFHDVTLRSHGVFSDTRKGGLQMDLTRAFEASDAEFAGMSALLDSGENNRARQGEWTENAPLGYVFALEGRSSADAQPQSFSNPADADWNSNNLKVRGPTWNLLRDYYRLYKQLEGSSSVTGRPFSPNVFEGMPVSETPLLGYSRNTGMSFDSRNRNQLNDLRAWGDPNQSVNVQRITRQSLAPLMVRRMHVFSLGRQESSPGSGNGPVNLIINSVYVLYNPYDVAIEFTGYKVAHNNFPFETLSLRREDPENGDETVVINNMYHWLRMMTNQGARPAFSMNIIATADGQTNPSARMRMQPGEVVVFSNQGEPISYESFDLEFVGIPSGPFYEEDSGIYFPRFGESGSVRPFPLSDEGRIWIEISLQDNWLVDTFLTPSNLTASSPSWNRFHNTDGPLQRIEMGIGSHAGSRVMGGLSGDYLTGAELGNTLDERVPFFVMDMRLKPLNRNTALFTSVNPGAMLQMPRYLEGTSLQWENFLYPINSFNEIDLDIEITQGRNNGYWGTGITAGGGVTHLPIFQIPRTPILSLADFTHADTAHFNHDPAFAIGNSYAHPLINQRDVYNRLLTNENRFSAVDSSYLLNEGLWDRCFLSSLTIRDDLGWTLDQTVDAFLNHQLPPANSRIVPFQNDSTPDSTALENMKDPFLAAAHMLRKGSLNVNSTSVSAWRAVLSGVRDREILRMQNNNAMVEEVAGSFYSRMQTPLSDREDLYQGFVELTDAQVLALAEAIVEEVKKRGPFLSLADFVNRRLSPNADGRMGPLQAAIESAGINNRFPEITPDAGSFSFPEHQPGRRAPAAMGQLLQSDVLKMIGPQLSARSDTFRIRGYGETVRSGNIAASARVEAVVQRVPTPVRPSTTNPLEPDDPERFGRRYIIVSFRYLNEDEY
ncbi:MAG: hypothetical protein JJU05_13465 [Verrucomicrobia bacterium]|nr:hypothetical protein [Verrucomicrobiota bacterium]MCH8527444.1 hypothetical protein [Kiritimatiellia bacterium]